MTTAKPIEPIKASDLCNIEIEPKIIKYINVLLKNDFKKELKGETPYYPSDIIGNNRLLTIPLRKLFNFIFKMVDDPSPYIDESQVNDSGIDDPVPLVSCKYFRKRFLLSLIDLYTEAGWTVSVSYNNITFRK